MKLIAVVLADESPDQYTRHTVSDFVGGGDKNCIQTLFHGELIAFVEGNVGAVAIFFLWFCDCRTAYALPVLEEVEARAALPIETNTIPGWPEGPVINALVPATYLSYTNSRVSRKPKR